MAADALVADVAELLAPHGIPVMPLKGALLQHWLYDNPAERWMTDVDLLVPRAELTRSVLVLQSNGYRRTPYQSVGGVVMRTRFGLELDLHPQLFEAERYRLTPEDVFARSSKDTGLYGVPVHLPCALDAYAHLVGKFCSDHLDAQATSRLDEISRLGQRLDAGPAETARHLVDCGMRRCSRYALSLLHKGTGDVFAGRVLERLPSDPIGGAVVALAEPVLAKAAPVSHVGAITAHLLNHSLPRGFRSGLCAWARRFRP